MTFPTRVLNTAPFVHSVPIVVCNRAEKHMLGVHAIPYITNVTHDKTVRNWAIPIFPHDTVDANKSFAVRRENSRVSVNFAAQPQPASGNGIFSDNSRPYAHGSNKAHG